MEFEIISTSNSITLLNKDKIIDYECLLHPDDKMSLPDLEKFLHFYKNNKSLFHQTFLNENNTKTLLIKEKDSGWRTPVEMKLVFKSKEIEDLSLLMNKKLDYILGKFEGKNEPIHQLTDLEHSALEKIEKIIENQNKNMEIFKKNAILEREKAELRLQESFELKEKDLLKKMENITLQQAAIIEKIENPVLLQKFEDSQKNQEMSFDNKLNVLSSNFEAFLTNIDLKSNNFLEKHNDYPMGDIIYRVIDTYTLLISDQNDVNYTGYVYNAYRNSCSHFEELKNNNLISGVGVKNGLGSIIIHKEGKFSEMILGGNNNVPGDWGTKYWENCNMIFYNGCNIVAVYKLKQGNSNGTMWNSFKLGFQMTRIIISGYCSFSKISFKE